MRVGDRTALVTGAGGPMGEAVATRLAEEGASLLLTDISGTRLGEAAERIRGRQRQGARLAAHRADVRNRDECAAVVAAGRLTAEEAYGAVSWPVMLLTFAMLGIGMGLERTGAAEAVALSGGAPTSLITGSAPATRAAPPRSDSGAGTL